MAPRKRSLSQTHAASGPDKEAVVPVAPPATDPTEAEPVTKRHKSDIDIVRARTTATTISDRPSQEVSAPPSEVGGDGPANGEAAAGLGDDSSPLKTKSVVHGSEGGGKEKKGRFGGPGKKGRGGTRRDNRGDFQRSQAAHAAATSETVDPDAPSSTAAEPKEDRRPKRKVAVCFGYVGTGYNGSQIQTTGGDKATGEKGYINPAMKTIEGEVFKAFVKAGCVSEDNSMNPTKVNLQRCSRTDANVHAACNVISLKLVLDPPLLSSRPAPTTPPTQTHHSSPLMTLINSFLPPEIRLWGYVRTLGSFQCRQMCDSRSYEYSLPTYVFLPPKPGSTMEGRLKGCAGWEVREGEEGGETEARYWEGRDLGGTFSQDLEQKRLFRMSPAMLARLRDAASQFVGVHNFSNYTVGKEFRDRSATRIVKEVEVTEPFIVEGTEWVSIRVWGQSFMLHQIRKMIGMLILLCRSRTPSSLIPETFGPSRIRIPKAPGLGLLLVHPHFSGYNLRVASENKSKEALKAKSEGVTEAMTEAREELEFATWKGEIDAFKKEMIYRRMYEDEKGEDSFAQWVNFLDQMSGPEFDYLNPKGLIPSSASFSSAKAASQPSPSKTVDPSKASAAEKLFADEAGATGGDADDDDG